MSHWSTEQVFHDGDEFYAELCKSMDCAQSSIDLETYIFDQDQIGERVLQSLRQAAARGVRVRLLLDGVGCARWTHGDVAPLLEAGLKVRFYHPLPWQMERAWAVFRLFAFNRWAVRFALLNRRNHRKVCVIDENVAYLGGMNISDWHAISESGHGAWRDTSVRVTGGDILVMTQAFESAWSGRRAKELTSEIVEINLTWRLRQNKYARLLRRILSAEQRVWITNAYFVPEIGLVRALRYAAWSGRDVRLLLPARPDVWGIKHAVAAYYQALLSAGVRVFEYRPSMLHAKVVLIDDWARVGSTNLNHRSLYQDLEIDVVLKHSSSLEELESQFGRDLELAHEIHLASWARRPWWGRVLERMALVFRRWL